jgi:hypothetical protein
MELIGSLCLNTCIQIAPKPNKPKNLIYVINIYGPCQDYKVLWENFRASKKFKGNNVIPRGDMNFIMKVGEIWGAS